MFLDSINGASPCQSVCINIQNVNLKYQITDVIQHGYKEICCEKNWDVSYLLILSIDWGTIISITYAKYY